MAFGLDQLNKFIGGAFAPLADLRSDDEIISFVEALGWTMPSAPAAFRALQVAAEGAVNALGELQAAGRQNDHGVVDGKTLELLGHISGVIGAIAAVPASVAGLPTQFLTETQINGDIATQIDRLIERRLLDRIVCDALTVFSPGARILLAVLGIIDETPQEEDPGIHRPEFVLVEIHPDRLRLLVTDQDELLKQVYGWDTPTIKADRLFFAVKQICSALQIQALATRPSATFISAVFPGQTIPPEGLGQMLSIPLVSGFGQVPLRLGIIPGPPAAGTSQALALRLVGNPTFQLDTSVSSTLDLILEGDLQLDTGIGVLLRPKETPKITFDVNNGGVNAASGHGSIELRRREADFDFPIFEIGNSTDLRIKTFFVRLDLNASPPDISIETGLDGGVLTLSLGDGDGFIRKLISTESLTAKFDLGVGWSARRGFILKGSGGLEVVIPLNLALGPVLLQSVRVALLVDDQGLHVGAGLLVSAKLGPVSASVEGVGAGALVRFQSGNLGPMDLGLSFQPPTGIGISVNGGSISGGGFLSFAPGRYSGAIELEAYSISIKAFGLIETGAAGAGFSFVIVISTEFATPIQLGLGFTLNGVGGLIGINRTVNSDALRELVVAGRTENLLFPKNVIANAPAIIRDLGTVFPAREGHYIFGPLAKLGWGTPTLITAELALILELPGPVLSLIGEVKCLLPKPATPLVKFNMSIAGQLDFPKKSFSLDAALHDSVIQGYPVSGQMAMRLKWGEQPNFALSIGGFHPAYQPPANFPKLQPLTIVLAQGGSTSVTVSGFFALTSNTLQIGGEARLHAGGSGISLDAVVNVKTIFIFSPFSFAANIDASVKISFHGYGPSVHLSGLLSGPSPWRAKGEVCVSIIWWDACLRFDQTFGGATTVPEPTLDPWQGSSTVQGLLGALQDPKNWAALPPPGSFTVVSRAPGASDLVDPLGGFTVRQKAVPVETALPIARFGPAKAAEPPDKRTGPIFFKGAKGSYGGGIALPTPDVLKDFFAPAQFFQMNEAKKLSAKSFDKYGSGYSFAIKAGNLEAGSSAPKPVQYTTLILGPGGTVTQPDLYDLPPAHLAAKSATSAVARGGFAQSGTRRFVDPAFTQPFDVNDVAFTLASADSLQAVPGAATLPRADALVALDDYIALHPEKRGQIQVVPLHELAAA